MPYDFTFKRITDLDNLTALSRNISLAITLTETFEEVIDLNQPDSNFHFTKTVIDSKKEYPEQHFNLEAEINGFFYHFSFWKDCIFVELGAGGDVEKRFSYLQKYAEVILKHGFQIEAPVENNLLSADIAFELHKEEYKQWAAFVEKVRQIHNSPD